MFNSSTRVLPACVEIRGLTKRYQYQPVLNDLSLALEAGDVCVLVGDNGAGKTTLLRILATLVRPDAGEVLLNDHPLEDRSNLRAMIGYLGHQSLFYGDLNAIENLTHYARLYQLEDPDIVLNSIRSVGLETHQEKPLRTWSRGMQQRLAIARACLHDPALLLLDEPYTGLDQESTQMLDVRLINLRQSGCTILIAAHRPQRLLSIATHIAWLKDGKICQHIASDQVPANPELHDYLREAA